MDWFLYDRYVRHERVKQEPLMLIKKKFNPITFKLLEYSDSCDKLWFL